MEKVKVTKEQLIDKTKQNIYQLLTIGLYNSDENIKEIYGGEGGLLNLIRGYFCLLEDMQGFKTREIAEQDIIKIFEEIQAYRAIGTVEEFKALKEKSVAKKPLPKGTHKGIDNFYCSNCNHPLTNRHEQCELPYCEICGQKLDWSE